MPQPPRFLLVAHMAPHLIHFRGLNFMNLQYNSLGVQGLEERFIDQLDDAGFFLVH
jgi:hypothetical protein